MLQKLLFTCLLCTFSIFAQSIELISPNGGETFSSGDTVKIQFSIDTSNVLVLAAYSADSGLSWMQIGTKVAEVSNNFILWVPYVSKYTNNVIVRVQIFDRRGIFRSDTSNSAFSLSPISDNFEPNNTFSTATPIFIDGSSGISAFTFGTDSSATDPLVYDVDYYKITLTEGNFLSFNLTSNHSVKYDIFDSSKIHLYTRDPMDNNYLKKDFGIIKSTGVYYIKFSISPELQINHIHAAKYTFYINQRPPANLITITAPQGGETFNAGQETVVTCKIDTLIKDIGISYSIDSGMVWYDAWYQHRDSLPNNSLIWKIPHLKNGTDRALIKVFSKSYEFPPHSILEKTFKIIPSPNDMYEPNNNFASAIPVSIGDSVIKSAIVINGITNTDSLTYDSSLADIDMFKISLTAGKVATIYCTEHQIWDPTPVPLYMGKILIRLYDASKNLVSTGFHTLSCPISQSGVYYIEFSSVEKNAPWIRYGVSIYEFDPLTILSPNGGEVYQAGKWVNVKVNADPLFGLQQFYYSLDNGETWKKLEYTHYGSQSWRWVIPPLKRSSSNVLLKVVCNAGSDTLIDVTDRPFTIQEAKLDLYEPNNTFETAYPIAEGDSVIINATSWQFDNTFRIDPTPDSLMDPDIYKISFLSSAIVTIRPFTYDSIGNNKYYAQLFDASKSIVFSSPVSLTYNIASAGTHFIKVLTTSSNAGNFYSKYGISVRNIKKVISQYSMIDSSVTQSTLINGRDVYTNRIIADKTNMIIDLFSEYLWVNDTIETMIFSPENFKSLKEKSFKIKTFAIQLPNFRSHQQAVNVVIPYESSDLNGQSVKSIAAVYQTDPTYDNWIPVTNLSIDTIKHQIRLIDILPFRFSMFQIYSTTDSTSSITRVSPVRSNGIKAFLNPQRKGIIAELSLLKASDAEFRLYDIQGRCLKKVKFIASAGFTTHQFPCKTLANGKYILHLKAGTYQLRKTVLLMN